MKLKPYPDYKDSGLPWLGPIPAHWDIIRNGFLFREVVNTGHPDLELLSIDRFRGIIRQAETGRKSRASEDRSAYKYIHRGELGYNLMNAFMGAIGVSSCDGILSPAYAVAKARRDMNPWYYHYLYRTPIYTTEFDRRSYGIMYERNRLYFDRFKTIPAPFPPIVEQNRIVVFIQQQEAGFRRPIHNKRRLIELLNEQKQAIINRAVTRGLDPNVRFKPSGIEWLGDVPAHWLVSRVKNEFCCLNHFWVNNHAHILKPKRGNLEYLANLMERLDYSSWISGAAQPKLTQDRLIAIPIVVPPVKEQDRIIEQIRQETSSLCNAITRAQREINLIREYHTRLIADVVTGKLNVRHLPVEKIDEALEDIEEVEAMEVLEAFEDQGEEEEDESSQTC